MKKKYNKPLTNTTMVRQQTCFCSSVYGGANKVESKGHEVGNEYDFDPSTGAASKKDEVDNDGFGVTWK